MFDFYQKRKLKTILTSRYTQAVLLILFLLAAWSAFTRYQIANEMEGRRVLMENERASLEVQRDVLQGKVDYLSDERGIEAEMRRQFDVAKDGEKVVVIVEPEVKQEVQPLSATTTEKKHWYQFWR